MATYTLGKKRRQKLLLFSAALHVCLHNLEQRLQVRKVVGILRLVEGQKHKPWGRAKSFAMPGLRKSHDVPTENVAWSLQLAAFGGIPRPIVFAAKKYH